VCCQTASVSGRSLVQRSPTECICVRLRVILKPRQCGGPGPLGLPSHEKKKYISSLFRIKLATPCSSGVLTILNAYVLTQWLVCDTRQWIRTLPGRKPLGRTADPLPSVEMVLLSPCRHLINSSKLVPYSEPNSPSFKHNILSFMKLKASLLFPQEPATEYLFIFLLPYDIQWAGSRSRHNDWLRAGRSGDRISVGARFSAPVQTGHGAYPASCTMGTGFFPGVKSGRGVTLTPQPLLVPWS